MNGLSIFHHAADTAGDVNGDGYDDVIVGAHGCDNGQTNEGKTFAWYGGTGGLGSSGTPANADWSAEGSQSGARFGLATGTDDVNHDQYDDVIVGADKCDNGQTDEGRAFAYLSTGAPPPTVRKYYYFNGLRIAMRLNGVLYYLVGDHLGSTQTTANDSGVKVSEMRYKAYGETRYSGPPAGAPTNYRFTGQQQSAALGLYHMGARWYDPYLNRWIQPDTIIPDPANPQSLNRYSYVRGNPLRYNDPTGHEEAGECDQDDQGCAGDDPPVTAEGIAQLLQSISWWINDPNRTEPILIPFGTGYFVIMPVGADPLQARPEGWEEVGTALTRVGVGGCNTIPPRVPFFGSWAEHDRPRVPLFRIALLIVFR